MRRMMAVIVCGLAISLAGCGDRIPASVSGGESKVFNAAVIETCGLTQADQQVIDENQERGTSAFGWPKPAARVPSCEELRAQIAIMRAENEAFKSSTLIPPRPAPKNKTWREKILGPRAPTS